MITIGSLADGNWIVNEITDGAESITVVPNPEDTEPIIEDWADRIVMSADHELPTWYTARELRDLCRATGGAMMPERGGEPQTALD